ncbi:hypothetical protein K435DRAFT_837402 [Dendrothele bispora CBS 962.96]|uniref:Uncharacterized protein n=1 Tax=Dendrothele bispora (strain CBS 962.96) TaxID=1314807 RepID=A0A4S8MCF4_DENBC|nr:hypothetical protein K435DRAFT_837402 [Dendrothele bispora CBS 962.96]
MNHAKVTSNLKTVLHPLSPLDRSGVHTSSITVGYVLKLGPLDTSAIDDAAIRLAKRWRLLAGHLEWQSADSTWAVRVPMGEPPSDDELIKFTTSKISIPMDVSVFPPPSADANSVSVISQPALKYFRHSSIPYSLSSFAKQKWPMLSIHITELTNCICIGLSVPHGVFDIFGCGQIIHGLDAELNGRPWNPPQISERNIMKEVLNDLQNSTAEGPESQTSKAALRDVQRDLVPAKLGNFARFGARMAYEHFWQKLETKEVFIEEKMLDDMVQRVKAEVEAKGKGWVSTGDIVVAWLLKAAHLGETDDSTVPVSTAVSLRQPFLERDPKFDEYTHNSLIPCSYPIMSKQEIANKSLVELAIIDRQCINNVRNIPFIRSFVQWVNSVGGALIPGRRQGEDPWIISNQVIGRIDDIDFGVEVYSMWFWNVPLIPDHTVIVNKFRGGYLLQAGLRQSRWVSIKEEAERMNDGEKRMVN